MAEEEVLVVCPPASVDNEKRRQEDLQPEAPELAILEEHKVVESNLEMDCERKDEKLPVEVVPDTIEVKRPRLDDKHEGSACENESQAEKRAKLAEENAEEISTDNPLENEQHSPQEAVQEVHEEQPATETEHKEDAQLSFADNSQLDEAQPPCSENNPLEDTEKPPEDQLHELAVELPQLGDFTSGKNNPESTTQIISREIEVPNNKVGVLIGKAGDTIRFLQYNSGAKIQITRDADADPCSTTRAVVLVGMPENINKAEKLIKDLIAKPVLLRADAGASPSLGARGFTMTVAAGAEEEIQIQVPNKKVGIIIGKGGDTIKSLQTRSGARIQLIPLHLPDGNKSKERTVRVSGDRKQVETARELIKEVMNQPVRSSSLSSSYNQQAHRPRGPAGTPPWAGLTPPGQPYGNQQRWPHPSQNQQYPPSYGHYPSKSCYDSGWGHRPPPMQQGPHLQPDGHGYDYYGGQVSTSATHPTSMGTFHSQANYNYRQPRAPAHGHQPSSHSHAAPPRHQSYQAPPAQQQQQQQQQQQLPYGGHRTSQPGTYLGIAAAEHQGYGYAPPQHQFNKPQLPFYGGQPQGAPPQSYAAASQPGEMQPYQAPISSVQPYPYASGGLAQSPFASAPPPATYNGHNQPPTESGYLQPGCGVPSGQQETVYAQSAAPAAGAYGHYPPTQQPGSGTAFGYQHGQVDPTYAAAGQVYGASSTGQPAYPQPAAAANTEASHDQSGGYGGVATSGNAPVGYSQSLLPQPQTGFPQPQAQQDASQMYAVAPGAAG